MMESNIVTAMGIAVSINVILVTNPNFLLSKTMYLFISEVMFTNT